MRKAVAGLLLLLAVLAGCGEASRVDPKARIDIEGQVTAPDGSPLQRRPVRLGVDPGVDDIGFAMLTVGMSCVTGGCTTHVFDASTDESGHYALTLHGKDTQTTFGEVRQLLLSVSAAPGEDQVSGASATAEFVVQTEHVTLPKLQLTDPRLVVGGTGPTVASSWTTRRAGPYTLSFEAASPVPVWQATAGGSSAALDGRLLEDSAGQVVLAGRATDAIEGSAVTLGWRSPGRPYASAVGAPPSRGARCRWSTPRAAVDDSSCGLSNGDLTDPVTAPSVCPASPPSRSPRCEQPSTVTLELDRPLRPDLLVVRGCRYSCPVRTSPDGRAFRAVGAASGDHAVVRLDRRPVAAVQVDLRGSQLRELSVWEPLRPAAALRPVAAPDLSRLRSPYRPAGSRSHRWLEVLAGALVLVVAVGVAFQLGRRRSRTPRG